MTRERLDFVEQGLAVAYRASAEPQIVRIRTVSRGPDAIVDTDVQAFRAVVDAINDGAAGGSEFSPAAGLAEVVSEPVVETTSRGSAALYTLRLAAVCPLFLRNMVEELRYCGGEEGLSQLSIFGELPADSSPLSAREAHVRAWLDDPQAFPGRFGALGFRSNVVQRPRGFTLRVKLAEPMTADASDWLEGAYAAWLAAIGRMVTQVGTEVDHEPAKEFPRIGVRKDEFWAWSKDLYRSHEPATAALLNILGRVHATRVKLLEVEVGA